MEQDFVTKEEFLQLKDRFNDLVSTLTSLELKRTVNFDEFLVEDGYEEDFDESEEEKENEKL